MRNTGGGTTSLNRMSREGQSHPVKVSNLGEEPFKQKEQQ